MQKESRNSFLDLYAFNENELTLDIDIEMANHFTSTWPHSIFRLHRMCSLPHPWGRVTLSDMELTVHRDAQSVSKTLPAGPQYISALAEHFGIEIDARYEDLAPVIKYPSAKPVALTCEPLQAAGNALSGSESVSESLSDIGS